MDNKIVFVRTSKGEDEVHSRTMHLPGDIKRALLMVDGSATYGEISKRAAPSLRADLETMLQELEKDGYIVDKAKAGNFPKMAVPPRMPAQPKMSIPPRMAMPHKPKTANEGAGDLDFMSGFGASSSKAEDAEADRAAAVDSKKSKAGIEEQARQAIEIEAAKFQAQQDAEALLHKAEQEAARIREEAEREKQRLAVEIHAREEAARRAKEEAEATRQRLEQEAKVRREAETKALQLAEAARKKAEQDAAIAHETAERLARQEREAAKAREEAEKRAAKEAEAPTAKPDAFVFGAFQVDDSQRLDKLHKIDQFAPNAVPAGAASAAKPDAFAFDAFHVGEQQPLAQPHKVDQHTQKTVPAGTKPDEFAFGAFHVDEPQPLAQPHQADQSAQKASMTADTGKPEKFSFDSFKVDIPQPIVEPPMKEKVSSSQQQGDVARAAQHPEISEHVQQKTSPIVAGKPVGDTPSKEEIQRATQERIETEKRMEAEALAAKKHAEAQAKAQAEAEKRLADAARAELEQDANQVKYSVDTSKPVAKPAPVARVRRKPFNWGKLVGFFFKLGVFLLVLLVGVLFALPYVLPTRDYMPEVEKFLSEKLHQPVHVGRLSGRILPTPQLELGEIYIGNVKQLQVEQTLINFAITGLIIDAKPIDSIELQGVKVSGAGLQNVSAWLQQVATDTQYPVARIVISNGTLDGDVVKFTGVGGALDFNKIGEFTKASLRSNEGKYTLDINADLGNRLQVAISVRDSALPLLPKWQFDELTAKGVLSNNDLSISEFDGRIAEGVLQGNASIDWHSGWRAQGTMVAKTITLQRLNNLLEGNVEGSGRFKMTSVDLAGLADSAVLEGNFSSKKGLISGMDIIETARTRSREHLPGGRTHFDELSGNVAYANNTLHLKQVKVSTEVLNAVATLDIDIDKQQISGSITAKLVLQEAMKPVDLQVGGVTDTPTLRFVP